LGVPVESWQLLNNNIHTLKLSYFGTPSVEIKSVWLRRPQARKKHYLDPYNITEAKLQECVTRFYEVLDYPSLIMFGSVVDKVQMTHRQGTSSLDGVYTEEDVNPYAASKIEQKNEDGIDGTPPTASPIVPKAP